MMSPLTKAERCAKLLIHGPFEVFVVTCAGIIMGIAALSLYWVLPRVMDWIDE